MRMLFKVATIIIAFILIGIIPLVASAYQISILSQSGIWMINSLGLAILFGFIGEISFGHAAFFGIGAYTSAILVQKFGFTFWNALLISVCLSMMIAALIGIPSMRTKGSYFALVTFAFGEIVRLILNNWVGVTNGPQGIRGIARPDAINLGFTHISFESPANMFYLIYFFVAVVVALVYILIISDIGKKFIAIREDDTLAEFLGINVFVYKTIAFVISAGIVALGGALLGPFLSVISPTQFSIQASIDMVLMNLLGGLGTIAGPIVGSIALITLPEMLQFMAEYRMIVWGAGIILLVLFLPLGIMGLFNDIYRKSMSRELGKG